LNIRLEAKTLIIKERRNLPLAMHAIAPLVWSQPHVILQNRSPPSLTITMPKTEAESNPVIPIPIQISIDT
jgi:hypothetical protein